MYTFSENVDVSISGHRDRLRVRIRGNELNGRPFDLSLPLRDINRWSQGESLAYLGEREREILARSVRIR